MPDSEANTFRAQLRAHGMRVTPQRLVLYAAVRREGHVTAERLFASAAPALPGLSLPTVYATLDLLVELGLVRRLDVGAGAAVYEPAGAAHPHAVCTVCGRLVDLDVEITAEAVRAAARAAGFTPSAVTMVVEGRCAACSAAD